MLRLRLHNKVADAFKRYEAVCERVVMKVTLFFAALYLSASAVEI